MTGMKTLTIDGTTYEVVDDKARKIISNGVANPLKGKVFGECALKLSDISPIPHIFTAKLSSRNKFLKSPYVYSQTINGVEFTCNSDGTIVANGTATANVRIPLMDVSSEGYELGPYFISGCPEGGSASTYSIAFTNNAGIAYTRIMYDVGQGQLINLENTDPRIVLTLRINSGVTVNNLIFKPQIVKGTSSGKFTTPVETLEGNILCCGKNCLSLPYIGGESSEHNGVTYTVNADGSVHAEGTLTSTNSYFNLSNRDFGSVPLDLNTTAARSFSVSDCSYNPLNKITCIYITGEIGDAVDKIYYPQVEVGMENTGFNSPIGESEYVVNSEGAVSEIDSIYPEMSILSGNEGIVIECEYNRDVNKAFESMALENAKLKQAIINLGGTI